MQVQNKLLPDSVKQAINELRTVLATKTNLDQNTIDSLNDLQVLLLASYVYIKYAAQTLDKLEADLKASITEMDSSSKQEVKTEVLTGKMYSIAIGVAQETANVTRLVVTEDFVEAVVAGLLTAASGGLLYACIVILDRLIAIIQSPDFKQRVTIYSAYKLVYKIVNTVTIATVIVAWVYALTTLIKNPDAANSVMIIIQLIVHAVLGAMAYIKMLALSEYEARTIFVQYVRELIKNPADMIKKLADSLRNMPGTIQISKREFELATRLD